MWVLGIGLLFSIGSLSATLSLQLQHDVSRMGADGIKRIVLCQGVSYRLSITSPEPLADTLPIPGLDNFRISTPFESAHTEWINGRTRSSYTRTFTLLPTEDSLVVTLGPVIYNQKTSNALEVEVVTAQEYQALLSQAGIELNKRAPGITCELILDKEQITVGESCIATLTIEDPNTIIQMDSLSSLESEGCIITSLGDFTASSVRRGGTYKKAYQKKFRITPEKEGTFTLGPLTIEVQIRQRENLLNAFFSLGGKSVKVLSNSITLQAHALPPTDKRIDGIGVFSFYKGAVSDDKVQQYQPFTYTITLTGSGNFDSIMPPSLVLPPSVTAYTGTTSFREGKSVLDGTKSFEYVLQCENSGDCTIPAQSFYYFDTEKKEYSTLQTDPLTIQVTSAPTQQVASSSTPKQIEVGNGDPKEWSEKESGLQQDTSLLVELEQAGEAGVFSLYDLFVIFFCILGGGIAVLYIVAYPFLYSLMTQWGLVDPAKALEKKMRVALEEKAYGTLYHLFNRYYVLKLAVLLKHDNQSASGRKREKELLSFQALLEQAAFAPQLLNEEEKKQIFNLLEKWIAYGTARS